MQNKMMEKQEWKQNVAKDFIEHNINFDSLLGLNNIDKIMNILFNKNGKQRTNTGFELNKLKNVSYYLITSDGQRKLDLLFNEMKKAKSEDDLKNALTTELQNLENEVVNNDEGTEKSEEETADSEQGTMNDEGGINGDESTSNNEVGNECLQEETKSDNEDLDVKKKEKKKKGNDDKQGNCLQDGMDGNQKGLEKYGFKVDETWNYIENGGTFYSPSLGNVTRGKGKYKHVCSTGSYNVLWKMGFPKKSESLDCDLNGTILPKMGLTYLCDVDPKYPEITGYEPQDGDTAVWPRFKNGKKSTQHQATYIHGHWVSDTIQNKMSCYGKNEPKCKIYRFNPDNYNSTLTA